MTDLTTADYLMSALKELGRDCSESEAAEILELCDYDIADAISEFMGRHSADDEAEQRVRY